MWGYLGTYPKTAYARVMHELHDQWRLKLSWLCAVDITLIYRYRVLRLGTRVACAKISLIRLVQAPSKDMVVQQ